MTFSSCQTLGWASNPTTCWATTLASWISKSTSPSFSAAGSEKGDFSRRAGASAPVVCGARRH